MRRRCPPKSRFMEWRCMAGACRTCPTSCTRKTTPSARGRSCSRSIRRHWRRRLNREDRKEREDRQEREDRKEREDREELMWGSIVKHFAIFAIFAVSGQNEVIR